MKNKSYWKLQTLKKKLEKIHSIIEKESSVLSVEKKIRGRVKNQMEKTQREYYLNEQLKAIQKELGEIDEGKDELSNLSKAIADAKMPKLAKEKCLSELKKLKSMSPMSAEATVVRNYLDWMTELPWSNKSKINTDLTNAQIILDQLNDSELRKGKVFVFSNISDGLFHYVRVNETERYMRDQEVQVFDLIDGKNNIFASIGSVVQLDRISDFGSDGWGFESLRGH